MKLSNYNNLAELAEKFKQNKLLFEFEFIDLTFKCLCFTDINTMLISIKERNVGLLISIDSFGNFNGTLPSEVFYKIREQMISIIKTDKVTLIWEHLDNVLVNLKLDDIKEVNDIDLISSINTTKTNDKKYDKEGENPFFLTWRRNKVKNVSVENLIKTEKYFGKEIRDTCSKNNVTSVWTEIATSKSLDFLNKSKVNIEINSVSKS